MVGEDSFAENDLNHDEDMNILDRALMYQNTEAYMGDLDAVKAIVMDIHMEEHEVDTGEDLYDHHSDWMNYPATGVLPEMDLDSYIDGSEDG